MDDIAAFESDLGALRRRMHRAVAVDEVELVEGLPAATGLSEEDRAAISRLALQLVESVRAGGRIGLTERFLSTYRLDTEQGAALVGLAEALLRTPDAATADLLIRDKLCGRDWRVGTSAGPLLGAMSVALRAAAALLGERPRWAGAVLGPAIRFGARHAMQLLGDQFVFAQDMQRALRMVRTPRLAGFRFSFDVLGESARTGADAERYAAAYAEAISKLAMASAPAAPGRFGISVKLSAIHPRYEFAQRGRVLIELAGRLGELARAAQAGKVSLTIDAEEAERLELSLDVLAEVAADPALAGWDGLGIVVQAYGKRALPTIDWLAALARRLGRQVPVRLVKGAYWDSEIKRAQALGLDGFPVYTRKTATDLSYLAAARRLFEAGDALVPQFATHNAHTAAAIVHLARQLRRGPESFEFQRLHGMGEAVHDELRRRFGVNTRIYAPVGPYRDLLAYLVRRLLENGANGSFVSQLADASVTPGRIVADPAERLPRRREALANPAVTLPARLFAPERTNSGGIDLSDAAAVEQLDRDREPYRVARWTAGPMIAGAAEGGEQRQIVNPADASDVVGSATDAAPADVGRALAAARAAQPEWAACSPAARAELLRNAADLFEAGRAELMALLSREAGKTPADGMGEVREAVDFLRYYAAQAVALGPVPPRGVFACISPWNFPLSIFSGQIAAALVTGNAVVAKPAEATPLIAARAVALLHRAGVPPDVLQLLPGAGNEVGAALVSDPRVDGVCFTGSLRSARHIAQDMAAHLAPDAPLIAETGGVNAAIVDSTALPEQVVRDVIASAFQSAGQRCSALRVLYAQEDIAGPLIGMLAGAMRELRLGDPWALSTDVGPVIGAAARERIAAHIERFRADGRLIAELPVPDKGHFVGPALLRVAGIADVPEEVFGPVLHVATFRAGEIDRVVEAINATGYGLTFALYTRLGRRIDQVAGTVRAGNIYVNRNQIGAVVGSQPFGGEGLSGTGPKAGGPHYLHRFVRGSPAPQLGQTMLPGVTGESNVLSVLPRGTLLCLGPGEDDLARQRAIAAAAGCRAVAGREEALARADVDAVACFGHEAALIEIRQALARRDGPIVPLLTSPADALLLVVERHVCIDTTSAGGNASLIIAAGAE